MRVEYKDADWDQIDAGICVHEPDYGYPEPEMQSFVFDYSSTQGSDVNELPQLCEVHTLPSD